MSAFRPVATLRALGVVVWLLGVGSAGLLYRAASESNPPPATSSTEYGSDSTLAPLDSKLATHDIELYGGKVEVLMVTWLGWLQRPESLAMIIGLCSTLIALGCFLVARHLAPEP